MTEQKKRFLYKALFAIFALICIVFGVAIIWASTVKLPDVSTFEARKIANSSKITDRTGTVILYDIHQSVRRTEIPLEEMGPYAPQAIIAIEDEHFYTHKGVRITSMIRATIANILNGGFTQGGSTLTQQIIKNTLLTADKTPTRKLKELILAIRLEKRFSKDEILGIYLNDAPYGGTIYGIEEASMAFFNKHAKELSVTEAAYLAAIPKAPTYYSPFGKNRDKLEERKNVVLKKMFDLGFIDETTYTQAKQEQVVFSTEATNSIKAPHFVFYVLDYLQKKYGENVMESGGYTIKTTLDYTIQRSAEEIVKKIAEENKKKFNAGNAALVALDPKTGQILALVGSKDYFDKTIDGAYNIATANRQPGSSFKPIVYLTAFAQGYTPETILFDVPTEFSTSCTFDSVPLPGNTDKDCYHPKNFDNKFKGPMTMRSALAESRNVPAVKTLYLVGLEKALETARSLGIESLKDKSNYGLSLVLGGGEVTLLEMVGAYGIFANSGVRNPTTGILEVLDRSGTPIESFSENSSVVFDKQSVLTLNSVLSDPIARTPTFGSQITLENVAVKTGTTDDDRDAWIIGYTPDIAVGVWSGNNDNTPMRSGGATVSGPIWKAFMQDFIKKNGVIPFEKPSPDPDYAALKPILRGQWLNIDAFGNQIVADILTFVEKSNPRGPIPIDPSQDPQYHLWEPAVLSWWSKQQTTTP